MFAAAILAAIIFLYLVKLVGWMTSLLTLGAIAVGTLAVLWYLRAQQAVAPCDHGVAGARLNVSKCPTCRAQAAARLEQQRLQAEAERKRREERILQSYREWAEQIRLPAYLLAMDPRAYQELIWNLFGQMGYRVEQAPSAAAAGADGYVYKQGKKVVLQCRRVQGSVGEPVLRDLVETMQASGADEGIFVTTGKVSSQARKWSTDKPIAVVGLEELLRLIEMYFPIDAAAAPDFAPVPLETPVCPRCHSALGVVRHQGRMLLGCTSYPFCEYTRKP